MTDTKPRTAEEVLEALRSYVYLCLSYPQDYEPEAVAEWDIPAQVKVLEAWRSELLADGWTYLPGEMPSDLLVVEAAIVFPGGNKLVGAVYRHNGEWCAKDDGNIEDGTAIVYAWRPLPEPPPVKGDG